MRTTLILFGLLLTVPVAAAEAQEECVVGGDEPERSGDACLYRFEESYANSHSETTCAAVQAANGEYQHAAFSASLCVSWSYEEGGSLDGHWVVVCPHAVAGPSPVSGHCEGVTLTVAGLSKWTLDFVDRDRDLLPDAAESQVCGRRGSADTVNGTTVPGHCHASNDYGGDLVGLLTAPYVDLLDADRDGVPEDAEPVLCDWEYSRIDLDGTCDGDEYHPPMRITAV